jgi:L-lactate dehydrogenase complex protein LldF
VTELARTPETFRTEARESLADPQLLDAYASATQRLYDNRLAGWAELPDAEAMRTRAHEIRMRVIDDLDRNLDEYEAALGRNGVHVKRARDAAEASAYVVDLCRRSGARLVAKSKSMASEEIGLNDALEAAGLRAVETDLGEYILQLRGGHPQHIVAPAIGLTADDVSELFTRAEGTPVSAELPDLAASARRQLREIFLTADVGVTGANFGVVETGSICLVTNEGNAGLVTALPRIHVALVGMERLVSTLDDLAVLLQLLARSGTGQKLTTYTRLLSGPRREGDQDGPEEMHVVILDNGRSNLRRGRYREMLACIRCGACLNVCPVYRKSGGGAYGPVYSGPMGAVLVPLVVGLERAQALPHASSLCGACTDACPVKIPLHELLLDLRRDLVDEGIAPAWERLAFTAWSWAWSSPFRYRASTALARLGQPLGARFGPGRAWASGRALPRLAGRRFRDRR